MICQASWKQELYHSIKNVFCLTVQYVLYTVYKLFVMVKKYS